MSRVSRCQYPDELLSLAQQGFEGVHILVLGDVLLDQSVYAETLGERPSKQPGLNVLKYEGGEKKYAGGAGTIARTVRACGATVDLCGVIGHDDEGRVLRRKLKEEDVAFHPILVRGRPTTVVLRFFMKTGREEYEELVRADRECSADLPDDANEKVSATIRRLVRARRPNAVVIADFGRGVARKRIIDEIGSWLNREGIPIVVDPKGTGWETWEVELAGVVPTAKETWDALRHKEPTSWKKLGADVYPPKWSQLQDCDGFVRAVMEMCSNVNSLCINDPHQPLLAIARDKTLHGLYRYALIDPPHCYRFRSPVGSEAVCTAFVAMALATHRQSPVYWDDFFFTAYAAKCLSRVKMTLPAEEIADPTYLAAVLWSHEKNIWTWPELPGEEAMRSAHSEHETNLQQAIDGIGAAIRLEDAKTDIPCVFAVNRDFRDHLAKAVAKIRSLKDEPAPPKPARVWVHGPSRIGKDFVVKQLAKGVVKSQMRVLTPDDYDRSDFSATEELERAQKEGLVLAADELDKGGIREKEDWHRKFLTPLDDKKLGSVFFVVMSSLENVEDELLKDLFNRLDPEQEARAVRINLPALKDRLEDVPYLLVALLQRWAGKDAMPSKISKRALEVLLRAPILNMQVINDVARQFEAVRLGTKNLSPTATALGMRREEVEQGFEAIGRGMIDSSAMAMALGKKPGEVRTLYHKTDREYVRVEAYERWDEEECSSEDDNAATSPKV